jgi:DNA-binding CsgD family transcriptional regulator
VEELLERESEMARLRTLIDESCAGAGRLVLIEGPPGIGKSRLLDAAKVAASARGMRVLGARGSTVEHEFGFGVARQLFEGALRGLDPAGRALALDGAAGLAEPLVLGTGDAPQASIFPSLHGLFWLCSNLADREPLLLAIDDAHWADEASVQWLGYLARRLDGVPALVIVTRRPTDPLAITPMLDALASDDRVEHMTLGALSAPAVAQLTERMVGAGADTAFVQLCCSRTGGNPFLLRELLASIAAQEVDPTSADAAAIVATVRPESISRSVLLRLRTLPSTCRSLAEAIAVLERDVELRHAASVANLDIDAASTALDALAAAQILQQGEPVSFLHPLLRDAIHGDLPVGRRGALHLAAARVLDTEGAAPERVAGHLLLAQRSGDEWVVSRLRAAARAVMSRGAPGPAVTYLERALEEPPAGAALVGVLRELGVAQAQSAPAVAVERLRSALALTAEPAERLALSSALANALMLGGELVAAVDGLERAIEDLPETLDPDVRLGAEAQLLSLQSLSPQLFSRFTARVEALPRLAGSTPAERRVLASVARCYSMLDGPWREVVEVAATALDRGRLVEDQVPDSGAAQLAALPLLVDGRLDDVDRLNDVLFEDARRRGSIVGLCLATHCVSTRHSTAGDMRAAALTSREALDLALECGWHLGVPMIVSRVVRALIERDELDEAEATLARHGLLGDLPDTAFFFNNILLARGHLRIEQLRPDEGLDDLLEISRREQATGQHEEIIVWRTLAAGALSMLGRTDEALALATEVVERARARGVVASEGPALRALGNALGGDEGITRLREAVRLLTPTPFRLDHAYALADLGAALRRANQRAEARDPLRQALDLAQRLGADRLAARVRTELSATGARPRRIMLSGFESLTPSELRVGELAARGQTNAQIAQTLFVTRKTVEVHLSNTYRKLGIRSRAELPAALEAQTIGVAT